MMTKSQILTNNLGIPNNFKSLPICLAKDIEELYINQIGLTNIRGIDEYPVLKKIDCFGNNISNIFLKK